MSRGNYRGCIRLAVIIKLCGLACIVLVGAGIGWTRAGGYSAHVNSLAAWRLLVLSIKSQMQYGSGTTDSMLRQAIHTADFKITLNSENGTCALQPLLIKECTATLPHQEAQLVTQLFAQLGHAQQEQEMEKLEYCAAQLALYLQRAQELERKNKQLCRVLGICGGAALALLLL